MADSLHVVLDENRHSLQQSQGDTPTQWRSFGKVDQILETETQTNPLRKFYLDIIRRILWIVIRFQRDLSISDIALTGKLDTSL
jgi:hypothetical protein